MNRYWNNISLLDNNVSIQIINALDCFYVYLLQNGGNFMNNEEKDSKTYFHKDTKEWFMKNDITNKERKGYEVILNTHETITKNIDGSAYNTYAGLKAISNFDGTTIGDWNNYILKRGSQQAVIDFMEEAQKDFGGKVPASRTVKRHVEKLINNDIPLMKVEKYNGKVYYRLLNCIDNKYYVRIPYDKVRELVISTNSNMLKLYAIMCYATNEKEYKPVTRSWLADKMGLSTKSNRGLDDIGTMLTSLCNLGFLECLQETKVSDNGNTFKTVNSYRITTLEEYKEAKNRGKIKK